MKHIFLLLLGFGLGGLVILFSMESTGAAAQWAAPAAPAAKPINGWRVCAELGVGTVPGFGVVRERFRLCQGDGWEVLAYCMEVGKTPPPLNAQCSYVSDTQVWCGEAYQYLQEYQVLATAAPTPAPSETPTATFTATATPTSTATHTATFTPTVPYTATVSPSATALATLTRTLTPVASQTSTRQQQASSVTPTRAAETTGRVRPGGPGNLSVIVSGAVFALLALLAAALSTRALVKTRQRAKERP